MIENILMTFIFCLFEPNISRTAGHTNICCALTTGKLIFHDTGYVKTVTFTIYYMSGNIWKGTFPIVLFTQQYKQWRRFYHPCARCVWRKSPGGGREALCICVYACTFCAVLLITLLSLITSCNRNTLDAVYFCSRKSSLGESSHLNSTFNME